MAETRPVFVLLIGDNLLAKKTFVNAFGYYLNFLRFEDALRSPDLIPRHYEPSSVRHGGSLRIKYRPSTKRVIKEYRVAGIEQDIRLIDVPTFGNVITDEDNLKKSINFLKNYTDIDAVYIFPRMWQFQSIQFKYLISFLMVHFEKTIFNKAYFVLNHASRNLREDLVAAVMQQIPMFSEQRVYISDDEVFNYLLAYYKGAMVSDSHWNAEEAWRISTINAKAMLIELTRENQTPAYKIIGTIILNQTRDQIPELTKKMADLFNAIALNKVVLRCETAVRGARVEELQQKQVEYEEYFQEYLNGLRVIGNYIFGNALATRNEAFMEYFHYRQTRANQRITDPEGIQKRFNDKNRLVDLVLGRADGSETNVNDVRWCLSCLDNLPINLR